MPNATMLAFLRHVPVVSNHVMKSSKVVVILLQVKKTMHVCFPAMWIPNFPGCKFVLGTYDCSLGVTVQCLCTRFKA